METPELLILNNEIYFLKTFNYIILSLCLLLANSISAQQDSLLFHNKKFTKHLSFKDTFFGSEDMFQVCYPKEHRNFFYFIILFSITTVVLGIIIIYIKNSSNKTLKEKNAIIAEQHKDLIDSITYAQRLQQAILPPQEFINKHLPENFVLYKPKDIVAGDFYWAYSTNSQQNAGGSLPTNNSQLFFLAAADSTGHGVPGAMVSVVCSNALNRAVKEFNITEPGKILDKARELVIETFEKSQSEVKDGMDISLLCIDKKNKKVFWSGANNPLWYVHNNELKEIKANKQPIGKTENSQPFATHEIEYKESSIFYLFTDGFADQFGGAQGKKFKYKPFSDLLVKHHSLSMKQQSEIIGKTLTDWKGNLEQVDDVCVIGIRI